MVRVKERYLLVNIQYPTELGNSQNTSDIPDLIVLNQPTTDSLTPQALLRGIRSEVANLFGDFGSGAIEGGSLSVKYISPATSTFILRISRNYYRLVWTALTFMNCVPVKNGKQCTFRVVHVSGTIKKVEQEAIRRARDLMLAVKDEVEGRRGKSLDRVFRSSKDIAEDVTMTNVEDDSNDEGEISNDTG